MDQAKAFFEMQKQHVMAWVAAVKRIATGTKQLKEAVANVQQSVPDVQTFAKDLQIQVEKMNFKNQPRLDRIAETQARIQVELASLKKKK
ncbi:hypothetical protein [Weissella cibaria]|uniref:hypothetical protein n=1 Tax=Weissella cibaria TaxID=137591 RepID=UPI00106E5BEF|nr:hypothetical protein [Weissella cibaria]